MKKFSKVLMVILTAMLLVGALALAALASTDGVDGKFVVGGVGYETWEEAVAAADNNLTIYINEDLTFDAAVKLNGEEKKLRISLGGHKIAFAEGIANAFEINNGAELVITGNGVISFSGTSLVKGANSSVATIEGTGAGIVINIDSNGSAVDMNAFRMNSGSTLNVYGKITANTNGVTKSRSLFNVDDTTKAVNLNIKNALITYATPTVSGAPRGHLIYSRNSNINIVDSKLDAVYCYVMRSATAGSVDVSPYIEEYRVAGDSTTYLKWNEDKIDEAKANLSINIVENITAKNSVFSSRVDGYANTGYVDGNLMCAYGATEAYFEDCVFYGYGRAFYGDSRYCLGTDSSNALKKGSNATQLTFVNSHFINNRENTRAAYLFCYGPVFRVFGGSISGFSGANLANGQTHYLELDNGQWLGGYVEDFFGATNLNPDVKITSQWQNPTAYNPDSKILSGGTVSLVIDGVTRNFSSAYISSKELCDKYATLLQDPAKPEVPEVPDEPVTPDEPELPQEPDPVWDNVVSSSDGNKAGANYYKPDGGTATGTTNFPNLSIGADRGIWETVFEPNGNGYMKHSLDLTSSNSDVSQSTTSKYAYIPTGSTTGSLSSNKQDWNASGRYSLAEYPQLIFEFDVRSDTGSFPFVPFNTQTRVAIPVYDENGKVISAESSYKAAAGGVQFSLDKQKICGVDFKATIGDWHRVTMVYDIKMSPVENVTGTAKHGSSVVSTIPEGLTIPGYSFLGSMCYIYVDGVLVSSQPFVTEGHFFGGALPTGFEDSFYLLEQRIGPKMYKATNNSWCIDNIRVSRYSANSGIDLGIYNEDGSVKTDIKGLDHFMIMLDNSTIAPPPPTYVYVDGVGYETDAEAIAAIKNGSEIELGRNMTVAIDVDALLAKLGLEVMSFTIVPNEFKVPTITSSNHGLIASEKNEGEFVLVPTGYVVDGVQYMKAEDALAALKDGSVLVLERDMNGTLYVDSLLEALDVEIIRITVVSGGFKLPTVVSSNHKLIESADEKGTYLVTPIGINVDGVEYATDAEAIAAIKDGSVVELNRDMKTAINVDELVEALGVDSISFKLIPGNFYFAGIISGNHKYVDYTGTFGGYLVAPAGFGEVYDLSYSDELFGLSGEVYGVAEGTIFPVGFLTAEGEELAYDGKLWSIIGWKDVAGNATANGFYSNADLVIFVCPEYKSETYYYEITVNGTTTYVTNSVIVGIEDALAKGDVKLVLWQNAVLGEAISVKGNLDIDLNGNLITVLGAGNVFNVLPGTAIKLYSSEEGSGIDASLAGTFFNVEYNRRKAGDVAIDISGVDIATAALVNYYDTYVHDSSLGKDTYAYTKTFALNITNSALIGVSYDSVIKSALPITINASGVDYDGLATLIEILPEERAALNASFVSSSFKSEENIVNIPGKNRSVRFENCDILAPIGASYEIIEENKVFGEEIISIGKGCSFACDAESLLDLGLKLDDGLMVVPANYGAIKSYVDTLDAMALIYWIGADGNAIAEPNYNAPFGKPVEQFSAEEAGKLVGNLEETDWYFVSFAGWDIAEDFELSAGAVSIYPKWNAPEASIKCLKLDLVAYTYFKLNLYLPEDMPDGVELYGIYREATDGLDHKRDPRYKLIDGKWYELLETGEAVIDGKDYSSYSVYPGAADASEPAYQVVFDLNGELMVDTIYCGVPTYAETAMKGLFGEGATFDELSDNDKILAKLVMNMVRYANESYKLANASAEGALKYEALLETYASLLIELDSISFSDEELDVDVSELGAYMEGASFIFGAYQPSFVFKYRSEVLESLVKPETTDGRIYNWPDGNRGFFAVIYHENYDGTKSHSYIAPHVAYNDKGEYVVPNINLGTWGPMSEAYATTIDMNVYNATGVINVELYSPEGTVVRGSYSLAAYISYLSGIVSEAEAIAAEATAIAINAAELAELNRQEALKPGNEALKDRLEARAAEYDALRIENEAIAAANEAIVSEYSPFLEASLSLYAFSLTSQDYDRMLANK